MYPDVKWVFLSMPKTLCLGMRLLSVFVLLFLVSLVLRVIWSLRNSFWRRICCRCFLVANKIPNFMRRLFAEGAFSQAFVPVLAEYQKLKEIIKPSSLSIIFGGVVAGTF